MRLSSKSKSKSNNLSPLSLSLGGLESEGGRVAGYGEVIGYGTWEGCESSFLACMVSQIVGLILSVLFIEL
ncbi:unnamed protein product [Camellia sinensis]